MSNLISFPDCPYKCTNGMIINAYTRKKVICPYCQEKRAEKLNDVSYEDDDNLYNQLKIPFSFTGDNFSMDLLYTDSEINKFDKASLDLVRSKLEELISDASIRVTPSSSLMFNLGIKVKEYNFIYPYMLKCFKSGLSITPLLTSYDIVRLRNDFDRGIVKNDKFGDNFNDYISSDICIVVIDAGVTDIGCNAVKGLMELRAYNSKPTIIFTKAIGAKIYDMCIDNDYCFSLANLISIKYISKEITAKDSNNVTNSKSNFGISSSEFNKMISDNSSL